MHERQKKNLQEAQNVSSKASFQLRMCKKAHEPSASLSLSIKTPQRMFWKAHATGKKKKSSFKQLQLTANRELSFSKAPKQAVGQADRKSMKSTMAALLEAP